MTGAWRVGLLAAAAGLGGCTGASGPQGERWTVTAVGDQRVPMGWWIDVENRRIAGGRDGCNAWHDSGDNDALVVADTQECPRDDATRKRYWAVIAANRENVTLAGREARLCAAQLCLQLRRAQAG